MQFNVSQREIALKVVYYGPPFSGKTTNLQVLHRILSRETRGKLTVLDTADDRTLFFDLLPVVVNAKSGYRIKLKLFTVPGQIIHAATRRIVLSGADGVVFVADSQVAEAKLNNEFWHGMRHNLTEIGVNPDDVPTVIQFNKRDLPAVRSREELDALRQHVKVPIFTATAIRGDGVAETLRGLLAALLAQLDARHNFQNRFQITLSELQDAIFGTQRIQPSITDEGSTALDPSPAADEVKR